MGLAEGYIDATFVAGLRVNPCEFRRFVYLTNGWEKMRRWGGNWSRRVDWSGTIELQEVPLAGITGPSQEPASWAPTPTASAADGEGWEPGVHLFRYRYRDSSTGYVSNPSLEVAITVAADKKLAFPIAVSGAANMIRSTDYKVDEIILEATTASGTVFFTAGSTKLRDEAGAFITSLSVEKSDAALQAALLPYDDLGHDPPPVKRWAVAHRGRLFLFGDVIYAEGTASWTQNSATVTGSGTQWKEDALGTSAAAPTAGRRFFKGTSSEHYEIDARVSDTQLTVKTYIGMDTASGQNYQIVSGNQLIYFSMEDAPESFPPLNFFGLPSGAVAGQVTAAVGLDQAMIFFTARSAYRFSWVRDPGEDGSFYPVPGDRGAVSQRVVVTHQSRVYSLDLLGVWMFAGGVAQDLSRRISTIFEALDFTYSDKWHAVPIPDRRAIRWYVTASGETEPKTYLQLHLDAQGEPLGWSTGPIDSACTESHLGWLARTDRARPYLGDGLGHCWTADTGTTDGAQTYHHYTAAAGTTSSIVAVAGGGLPTDGSLRGVAVYWHEGDETRFVLAHTATTLILTSAFSGTPATGDTIWLGRIRGKLKSRAFYPLRGENKQRPRYIRLFWTKHTASRKVLLRVYDNLSSTPRSVGADQGWGTSSYRTALSGRTFPGANADYADDAWLIDLSSDPPIDIPVGPKSVYAVEIELEVIEPDTPLRLWRIEIEGVEDPSPE